jgi:hypothetical protein
MRGISTMPACWLSYAAPDGRPGTCFSSRKPKSVTSAIRVLWLGRVKMRGSASQIPLDQEFAVHARLRDGQVITVRAFLAWREALEAVGLSEQDAHGS